MSAVVRGQRRWRKSYRYWEDQIKTSLPRATAVQSPRFTLSVENQRRKDTKQSYIDTAKFDRAAAYYKNKDATAAVQMMQAKDMPMLNMDDTPTVETYLRDALNATHGVDQPGGSQPSSVPRQTNELSGKELAKRLKLMEKLDKKSKDQGHKLMDAAVTRDTDARNKMFEGGELTDEEQALLQDVRVRGLPEELGKELRAREDFHQMPTMEDAKGKTDEERLQHYLALMDDWSTKERIHDDMYVSMVRKKRKPGAPQTERWTARDENAHQAAKLQYIRDVTSLPGVRLDNLDAVVGAARSGKTVGLFNTDHLRGPTWQL